MPDVQEEVRCGTYQVFENRQTRRGRKLPLKIVLLPARNPHPEAGPVISLGGGPGETNTDYVKYALDARLRQDHDILFIDSRGTGDGHKLACHMSRSADHLEGYLQTPFTQELARACHRELERKFDLSQYSTAAMVDDLDEVREALGYDQVNLEGGSFGTYAALMYIRAHGEHVRSASLVSLVTLENRVPLYHAQGAQWALDRLFECAADAACRAAYPNLREDFSAEVARLRKGAVQTSVRHPLTGARTAIGLTEQAFADAVRAIMYSGERGRGVPFLIAQARAGNFDLLAETVIEANRGFYGAVPLGLYYAVTCNEFVNRIRPEDVEPATRGSYAGAWRVHSYLPNSVHVIVPDGHFPVNDCTYSIASAMILAGSTKGLDVSCAAKLRPAPFKLPSAADVKASVSGFD